MKKFFFPFLLLVFASAAASAQEQTVREERWALSTYVDNNHFTDTLFIRSNGEAEFHRKVLTDVSWSAGSSNAYYDDLDDDDIFLYDSWYVLISVRILKHATWKIDQGMLILTFDDESKPVTSHSYDFSYNLNKAQQSLLKMHFGPRLRKNIQYEVDQLKGTVPMGIDLSGEAFRLYVDEKHFYQLIK